MTDRIINTIAGDGFVSAIAVDLTHTVEAARMIHKTLPVVTAALGRTLSAASMMGAQLKAEDGSVTIQIKGDGPIGSIVAVANSRGDVRGYVQNPAVIIPLNDRSKLDVGGAVGRGTLTVIKDLRMREPYSGTVSLESGEIAEDIVRYFDKSEQISTACALGVLVGRDQSVISAGGYLIQLMPGASQDMADRISAQVEAAGPVTAMLSAGMSLEDIVRKVLAGFDMTVLSGHEVAYKCFCDENRVVSALISMGRGELEKLSCQLRKIEVTCQFCDREYAFDVEELLQQIKEEA